MTSNDPTSKTDLKKSADVTVYTKELFKSTNAIKIVHNDETYTLRITKGDKLILTK